MKVEVSTGEVLDKISILEIKLHRIDDEKKLENVRREHHTLIKELQEAGLVDMLSNTLFSELLAVNLGLWDIEDKIRHKERLQQFDEEFVSLARSIYIVNDERARLKREINEETNSLLMEEKSYAPYTDTETAEPDSNSSSDNVDTDSSADVVASESDELE